MYFMVAIYENHKYRQGKVGSCLSEKYDENDNVDSLFSDFNTLQGKT